MPNVTQTTTGLCPTHGDVDATREIPQVTFPPIITAVMRAIAVRRRPYPVPNVRGAGPNRVTYAEREDLDRRRRSPARTSR
jgi:hypothetical protein